MQPLKSFRKLRSEFRSLLFKLLERFQLEISYLLLFVGCALFLLSPHVLSESYYVDEKSLMPGDVRTTRSDSYFRSLKGNVRDLLLEINEHSEMELMEFPNGSLLLQVPSFSSRNGETFLFHTFFDCELSLRALLRIARSHVGTLHQRLHLSIAVTAPLPEAYDTLIDELLRRGYVITAALTLDVCRGYKAEKNDLFAVDAFGFHGHQPKFDYVVTVAQEFQKHVSGSTMIGNPERILNFSSRFDWFSFWIPEEIFQRTTHYFASLLSMIDLPSLRSSHAYFKEYAIPAVTVRNFSVHEVDVKPRHEFEISRALDEVLRRVHNIEMRINRSEPLWFIVDNMNFISDGRAQICRYLLVVAIGFLGVAQTHQRSESESTTRRFVVLAFITGSSLLSLLSGSSEFLSLFTTMAQILMSGFVRWHFPVRTTTSLAAFSAMVAIVTITGMNAALATFSSVTFSLILILTFMWRSKLLLRTLVALILSPSLICFLVEPISESDLDLFMRILYVPIYSMTLMIPSSGVDQSSPTREHTFERNGGESLVVKKRM